MSRVHLIISGDVQGVGYRAWVWRLAKNLHLVGWVKNREDGAVEVTVEGSRGDLEELIKRCQNGPDLPATPSQACPRAKPREAAWARLAWRAGIARVERVDPQWSTATDEFTGFEVLY